MPAKSEAADHLRKLLLHAKDAVVHDDAKRAIDAIGASIDMVGILACSIDDAWIQAQEANRQRDEYQAEVEKLLKERTV